MKFQKNLILVSLIFLSMSPAIRAMEQENHDPNILGSMSDYIRIPVLDEWLDLESFGRLDTANCNHRMRDRDMETDSLYLELKGTKRSIVPVTFFHPSRKIRLLALRLQEYEPAFWAYGGPQGRIYRITDPKRPMAPPFLLSDEVARDLTRSQAINGWDDLDGHHPPACEGKGTMPTLVQHFHPLLRAMKEHGTYNPNAIAGMDNTRLLSTPSRLGEHAFVLHGQAGITTTERGFGEYLPRYSVRCVMPAEL